MKLPLGMGEMPFLDHLEELRRVLIDSLVAIGVGMLATWALSGWVLEYLISTTMPAGVPVIFLGPAEAFSARIKVALTTGVVLTLPFVLWRVWRFIVPGLLKEERNLVLPLVLASCALFYVGGAFGLLVLVPVIMNILLSFGTASMVPNIAVGQLLTFILRLVLACGTIFELPLVTTALALAGLVTGRDLIAWWRHAVVAIFVVAAVVTPGDGPSMLVLAIPMIALYFLSVGLAFAVAGRSRKRTPAPPVLPPIVPRPAAAGIVPRPTEPAAPPASEEAGAAPPASEEAGAAPPASEEP